MFLIKGFGWEIVWVVRRVCSWCLLCWRKVGRRESLDGEVCVFTMFYARIILIIYYMCLYALVCDYLFLCVFYSRLVDFGLRRVFWSFDEQGWISNFIKRVIFGVL